MGQNRKCLKAVHQEWKKKQTFRCIYLRFSESDTELVRKCERFRKWLKYSLPLGKNGILSDESEHILTSLGK